jgi:hypothetical protein
MRRGDACPNAITWAAAVVCALLSPACGGDDGSDTTFGSADTSGPPLSDTGATTSDDATGTPDPSAGDSSSGPTPSTSTTDPDPSTDSGKDSSSGDGTPDPTTGGVDGAALGDCIGTGAWDSCAQYCSARTQACVEGGCDGATVVYYGDVGDCTSRADGQPEADACDADFAMGGGISFARCCCG